MIEKIKLADVVKLANTKHSKCFALTGLWVRLPPSAQSNSSQELFLFYVEDVNRSIVENQRHTSDLSSCRKLSTTIDVVLLHFVLNFVFL